MLNLEKATTGGRPTIRYVRNRSSECVSDYGSFRFVEDLVEERHSFVVAFDHSFRARCIEIQTFRQGRRVGQYIGPRGNASQTAQQSLPFLGQHKIDEELRCIRV